MLGKTKRTSKAIPTYKFSKPGKFYTFSGCVSSDLCQLDTKRNSEYEDSGKPTQNDNIKIQLNEIVKVG